MKKLILIIFSIFFFVGIYAQTYKDYVWTTSFSFTASEGDTVNTWALLNRDFVIGVPYSLSIDYSTITTSDVKLGLLSGNSPWVYGYESIDGTNLMLTLDNTAYHNNLDVDVRTDNYSSANPYLYQRLGIQVITTTEVTGTITVSFIQRLYFTK